MQKLVSTAVVIFLSAACQRASTSINANLHAVAPETKGATVTKDTKIETHYFPSQSCILPKGSRLTFDSEPKSLAGTVELYVQIATVQFPSGSQFADAPVRPAHADTPKPEVISNRPATRQAPAASPCNDQNTAGGSGARAAAPMTDLERALASIRADMLEDNQSAAQCAGGGGTVVSSGDNASGLNLADSTAPQGISNHQAYCTANMTFLTEEALRIAQADLQFGNSPSVKPETVASNTPVAEQGEPGASSKEDKSPNFFKFVFPLRTLPYNDWHSGAAAFNAYRDNGARKHAAVDLYYGFGKDVLAVADGVVMDFQYFYQGVYELPVKHVDGRIVRYGEVLQRGHAPVGSTVKMGQRVALVGKTDCCEPMLHLEIYSGTGRGSLTDLGRPPFKRRADLLNPTKFVDEHKHHLVH